jgi:hypothetical protein
MFHAFVVIRCGSHRRGLEALRVRAARFWESQEGPGSATRTLLYVLADVWTASGWGIRPSIFILREALAFRVEGDQNPDRAYLV